jgi:hypothetical protein
VEPVRDETEPENGPRVRMASVEAGSDSSHKGLMWKQLNRRDLDQFSTSPKRLRLLLVFLLLYLI